MNNQEPPYTVFLPLEIVCLAVRAVPYVVFYCEIVLENCRACIVAGLYPSGERIDIDFSTLRYLVIHLDTTSNDVTVQRNGWRGFAWRRTDSHDGPC